MGKSKFPEVEIGIQYARDVAEGKILTGKLARLACERQLNDLKKGKKRGLHFNYDRAQHILDFYKFLRHSKGEWRGQPFELEPWQIFKNISLFGWEVEKTGFRRFRTAYNEVPRKNGKSTDASGTGLYMFMGDGEPGAEVYSAATKRDQSKIVFDESMRMVKASPALKSRIDCFRNNMSFLANHSKYEPLGADQDTMDGLNVSAAIIDELHAHKHRGIFDVLETATGARREPLIYCITTAGYDKLSICWELRDYSEKVLKGIIEDDTFFALIYCIDEEDDWTDEKVWGKANPNLGVSVKLDDLRRKAKKAKNSPGAQNAFRRLHLNEWTEQAERWLDMAKWDECGQKFELEDLEGQPCWAGLDLSATQDTTSLVLMFWLDGKHIFVPFFWLPEENIREKSNRDRAPYDQWARDGYLNLTDGNTVDYDEVRAVINELSNLFDIQEIAIDRWNANQITTQLQGDGFTMLPFGQGYGSMQAPTKELEKLMLSQSIAHGGHPVLRWQASNVAIKLDPAGCMKPDKGKSTGRIDGIVSMIMALGSWQKTPEPEDFVYNSRGVYVG